MSVKNAVSAAFHVATRGDGKKYSREDTTAPSAPSIVATVSGTTPQSQIDLVVTPGVDAQSGVIGHNIYRATASGGPYTLLTFITGTTYTDSNLPQLTQFWYKAETLNAFNLKSSLSAADDATTASPNQQLTGWPVYDRYTAIVTDRGGTPISNSNTRYWSGKPTIPAGGTVYTSVAALNTAIASASSGAVLKLQDGTYNNQTVITVSANGVKVSPETAGGAHFTGSSHIKVTGNSNDVLGFSWTNTISDQILIEVTGTDNVIALNTSDGVERSDKSTQIHHVHVRNVRNRVCYNTFDHCTSGGRYIHVQDGSTIPRYCSIDHNRLLNKSCAIAGVDPEVIQVGQAQIGTDYFCLIYGNYIYRWNNVGGVQQNTDGEIFTIKSSRNVILNNALVECCGALNLRQSSYCDVAANYFDGNNVANTGGVGIYGVQHRIWSNHFLNLNSGGNDQRAALRIGNGDNVDTDYFAANGCEMAFNTTFNCRKPIIFSNNTTRSGAPTNNKFYNCAIDKNAGSNGIIVSSTPTDTGTTWSGVICEATVGRTATGLTSATPGLTLTNGLYTPTAAGNLDGTAVTGYSSVITVDILGNAIADDIGAIQLGFDLTNDPVQAIITAAGA